MLEVAIYGGLVDNIPVVGYRNMFSKKTFCKKKDKWDPIHLEILALLEGLRYLLYGTHRVGTIYVNSSKILNWIHNPDYPPDPKYKKTIEDVFSTLKKIRESIKMANIYKQNNEHETRAIKQHFHEQNIRKIELERAKKKNSRRSRSKRKSR